MDFDWTGLVEEREGGSASFGDEVVYTDGGRCRGKTASCKESVAATPSRVEIDTSECQPPPDHAPACVLSCSCPAAVCICLSCRLRGLGVCWYRGIAVVVGGPVLSVRGA